MQNPSNCKPKLDAEAVKEALDNRAFYEQYFSEISGAKSDGWLKKPVTCPFHDDKNPSFTINIEHGGWKCWAGCGSGDCFSFYQKMHGVSFVDALRAIASFAGLDDANPERLAELSRQAEQRRIKRAKRRRFEQWQRDYSTNLGRRLMAIHRRFRQGFKDMAEAENYANLFHSKAMLEHHLEILAEGDATERALLYREVNHG
jgi:DNA primase